MARAVAAFRPAPHRLAQVGVVRGVSFVDDSKATNPHAAATALAANRRIVWIAGGRNKGLAFDDLVEDAVDRLVGAVLLGEAAEELAYALGKAEFEGPVVQAASMGEAVTAAFGLSEPGDTVLLAPACASQDMFTDYGARGDAFAAAVARLGGFKAAGQGGERPART
jgi:UDP-N-acetylmuramoylalanine--D-glutamate ligase